MKGSTESGSENYKTNSCRENKKKRQSQELASEFKKLLVLGKFHGFPF